MTGNPFTDLGLPADPGLTDEQVRAAWRAIATATHPDRADGGDPARYAAASAAYTMLRTPWGRSEAYADLIAQAAPAAPAAARATVRMAGWRAARLMPARIGRGRPWLLLLRVFAAVLAALLAMRSGAGGPSMAGVVAGLAVWLVLTVRGDLAPPPGR
jgi:hypothetical protein